MLLSLLCLTMAQTSALTARLLGQTATGMLTEMNICTGSSPPNAVASRVVLFAPGAEHLRAASMHDDAPRVAHRDPCTACAQHPATTSCTRCSSLVCDPCRAPEHCVRCAFDVAREVLAGRRVQPRPGDWKIVRALLGFGDGDIRIDVQGIERHRVGARRPDRYFAVLAPFVVGELLDRAQLVRLDGPTVAGLREAPIPGFEPAPDIVDLCVWFLPEPDALRILLRRRVELPAAPQPIPAEGPFAVPEPLSPWSPPPPKFREEPAPRACPHCRTPSTRFRDLDEALVCLVCGQSFSVRSKT